MAGIARFAAVSLDTDDPGRLGEFYAALTGGTITFSNDDFVAVDTGAGWITAQRVQDHRRTTWPDDAVPKQIHLEFGVPELDESAAAAVAIGATVAGEQPSPDRWRVMVDPAGHLFCLTTLIPAD
jgi:predicted enzyme related to lactoylglutathione lyase